MLQRTLETNKPGPTTATTLTISLLVMGLFAFAACSKDKKKTTTPDDVTSDSTSTDKPAPSTDENGNKTEVVDGDLRDAILALRRVHFPYDSSTLVPASRDALADAASKLVKYPKVAIFVQGHSDQRGTTEYNIALGDRRAQIVADYLSRAGIGVDRLKVVSYGEEKPLVSGGDSASMSKNRRVDFKLMRGDVQLVIEEGTTLNDGGDPLK